MSLYRAETRRLVKRRFIRYAVLGAFTMLLLIGGASFLSSHKNDDPQQLAIAQQQAEADYQNSVTWAAEEKRQCDAATAAGTVQPDRFPPNCEITQPAREDYDVQNYLPPTFDFREGFGGMITAFAALMALVAFIAGASFVGAEWASGGMMNLLLWRPRRIEVLGTKLTALLTGVSVVTVVAGAIWTVGFWFIAVLRGSTERMTFGAWQSFGLMGLRAAALILAATTIGFALAALGRHTAISLGVAVGAVIVLQFGLVNVLSMTKVKYPELFLAPIWVMAWMDKSVNLQASGPCEMTVNGCRPETLVVDWQMAGGVFAVLVVLFLGVAMWSMRTRDVT